MKKKNAAWMALRVINFFLQMREEWSKSKIFLIHQLWKKSRSQFIIHIQIVIFYKIALNILKHLLGFFYIIHINQIL